MRLKDIEADEVVREMLGWGVTSILVSVHATAAYARGDSCPWGQIAYEHAIITLMRVVHHAPHPDSRPDVVTILESNAGCLDTAFDVVMFAAWCRQRLEDDLDVTTKQLAALSSMAHGSLKMAGTRGSIQIKNGRVENAEARRWLAARGVPGFKQEAGE